MFGLEDAQVYSMPLLGGDAGTEQTINVIRDLVDDAWKDPIVNRQAIQIVLDSAVPQFDSWGQVRAVYDWVARNFYFIADPVSKETLRPARELLRLGAGDCDDINAILLPALLGNLGYEPRLITIAANPASPDEFSHVYAEVQLGGQWIPVDAARQDAAFGVAPSRYFRKRWWSLVDSSCGDLAGVGVYPRNKRPALGGCGYLEGLGGYAPARTIPTSGWRSPTGLAGYAWRNMGQDSTDWTAVIQSIAQQTPQIIRAATGQPQVIGPGGYPIDYTRGVTYDGYGVSPSPALGISPNTWVWIAGGLGLLLLARR